jgi:formate dehydrogenase maturation protein FdhE
MERDYCEHCGGELDTGWARQTSDDDGTEYKFCSFCGWCEIGEGEHWQDRIDEDLRE